MWPNQWHVYWRGLQYESLEMEMKYMTYQQRFHLRAVNIWGTFMTLFTFTVFITAIAFLGLTFDMAYVVLHVFPLVVCLATLFVCNCCPPLAAHVAAITHLSVALLLVWSPCLLWRFCDMVARVLPLASDEQVYLWIDFLLHCLMAWAYWVMSAICLDVLRSFDYSRIVGFLYIFPCLMFPIFILLAPGLRPLFMLADGIFLIFGIYQIASSVSLSNLRRAHFMAEAKVRDSIQTTALESDVMLHHVLKNTMAEACGQIEQHMEVLSSSQEQVSPDLQLLSNAVHCLRRGMRWCQGRQALLAVAAEQYTPCLTEVNLCEFGEELASGFPVTKRTDAATVLVDAPVCQIIVQSALINAIKHGDPSNPDVHLAMQVTRLPNTTEHRTGTWAQLGITVTNRVDANQPEVTPRLLQELMCEPAPKNMLQRSGGISLRSIMELAQLSGMNVTMSQTEDIVSFTLSCETQVLLGPVMAGYSIGTDLEVDTRLPAGVRIACLDDSAVSLKILQHQLQRWCGVNEVDAFGQTMEEIPQFVTQALATAEIAILDQNLDYPQQSLSGTDIMQELLNNGFHGLICIRSGNTSDADNKLYRETGAHCILPKELPGRQLASMLYTAYLDHLRSKMPEQNASISSDSLAFHNIASTASPMEPSLPGYLIPGEPVP